MAKGIDFIIKVNTGTAETPVYTSVGGQRGAALNRATETIDSSSKDSNGWQESDVGLKNWGIETDGLLIEDDTAYGKLETAYMASDTVKVQLSTPAEKTYTGDAIITDFPIDAPYDDVATFSISLQGTGALTPA